MEIMTPPISPTHEITSTSNYLCERGSIAFHCLGDAEKKASFDPRGFLVSGAITNPTNIQSRKSSFVTVFNQEFDMDISKDELKRLFRICWNKLCLIDSTQKIGTYGFTSDTDSLAVNVDEVRQDLREFFAMLHLFVESQGESVDKSWILKETLPTLLKGLDLLRNQLGFLSDLPSYVLSHSQVKNCKSPGHHLFHWHLEARWLHISVLWALSECLNSTSIFEATEIAAILQPYSAEQSIENLLQSTIKFCIIDLVEIAVLKFNKLNQEMIVHSSPFHCLCVKELWLLLKFITESLNDHDTKAFWKQLDECLQLVVKADTEIPPKKGWRPLQTKKFQKIVCLEPGLFALWLLRDVGEIYMFTPDGLLSPVRPEMDKGQGIVKCVLNDLIGSNDLEEPQRRTLISLIKGFMDDPWKPKPEPIMMLWEGFSRKLDCAFQCPGAPASSFVIASDTIEDILSSVNFEPSNKPRKQLNSFELFLSLLATYLAQDKNVWKAKICGRFYSKLSEKKVNGLSEMGVFHLTQVFLSIALATEELEELGGRFFGLVSFCETDKKRNQMIMKAKLCFVFLLIKHGKALSPLAGPLTNTIDSLIVRNQKPVVEVFIANLEIAIRSTDELPSDFHILFGPWVKNFLDQNHQDTTMLRSLLNLMIDVMQKLQVYMDCNNIVGGGMQELVKRLHENLLPYLKDQKSHDWEIADLAFQFTLISLEFNSCSIKDNFQNLVHHFTTSDNFMLVKRFLHRILSCRKITNIIDANESLQILFVQAWVRCCMCSNVGRGRETEVAQKIFLMPVLKNTFNLPANNFVTFSDPLLYLVEAMGKASSANKKIIAMILEPLQQLIPLIKSSLFPAKSKDISWVPDRHPSLDNDSIERSYLVFATLTAECPSLIYEKNKSSNLLVTLVNYLILHPHVFNMDVKLPLPMENGVRNSLLLFIKGLFKLDPKREKCIERFLKSIIKVYVPRYIDPFTKIWDEPEDMPSAIYIIQSVCETLLQVDKNNVPHKYYCQGLTLMNTLIQRNGCDEILIGLLIDNVLPNCLYVVAKVTDMSAGNRRQETEHTLGLIFDTEVFQMSISLREQATNVLNQQSHKFLSFNASLFMRMLLFLMKVSKPLVKSFYPTLEKNVRDVISKRGSGNDKNLETFLAKVKEGLQI